MNAKLRTILLSPGARRVPEVTAMFWALKLLSTAFGEATSDYFVKLMGPKPAVVVGFVGFCIILAFQLTRRRYQVWSYWIMVAAVGVFGTMAADVFHKGFGVPYAVTSVMYAVLLVAVFLLWYRYERTLSIHHIDTTRRELFYWATVLATFAMGTALGDFTAHTLHMGFLASTFLFLGIIAIPAIGAWRLRWNRIFSFWFAYVITRPLGASFADWTSKPHTISGLNLGDAPVSIALGLIMLVGIAIAAKRHIGANAAVAIEPA